jgi:hypothetical protein
MTKIRYLKNILELVMISFSLVKPNVSINLIESRTNIIDQFFNCDLFVKILVNLSWYLYRILKEKV